MKILQILILALASLNCFAASVTIAKEQLVGEWVSHYGFGVNKPSNATSNSLKISNDFKVTLTRAFDTGNTQHFQTGPSSVEVSSDIYIFSFPAQGELSYKLVLNGWVNGDSKLLFGMLYLYNNGELFNGIPVSFKPKSS